MSTKTEQYATLERFFNDCVRFWAHELSEDPDLSKEPHKHALAEIPSVNPYCVQGEPFNQDVLKSFTESRYMDTYGRDWKQHWAHDGMDNKFKDSGISL